MAENHTAILTMTSDFFQGIRMHVSWLATPIKPEDINDIGLRESLLADTSEYAATYPDLTDASFVNTKSISIIRDIFNCFYIFIPHPAHANQSMCAGPFVTETASITGLTKMCHNLGIPSNHISFLQQYYSTAAYIRDYGVLEQFLNALARQLYGENGSVDLHEERNADIHYSNDNMTPDSEIYEQIEERYREENEGMRLISKGDASGAEHIFCEPEFSHMTQRSTSTLRNRKNYSIVANTLYRKAAEAGGVHPIYLDEISGKFAVRIDRCNSLEEMDALQRTMIRQYCMLVQSRSTTEYSDLISKVINYIALHLEDEISLALIAQHFSVNRSYLASRFKEETGHTLTDYINGRRIDYATELLNRQTGSIQEIAAACGISNMTYFTRLFRRYRRMTPTAYRKMIAGDK